MKNISRVALAAGIALALAGCVRRTIFVRTDPDKAKIFLDGTYLGDAPRLIPFAFYGTRDLVVRAADRDAVRLELEIDPPWYEYTPIDFFAEILWPWTIEDERQVFVTLPPVRPSDVNAVRSRADAVRTGARGGE